MPKRFSYKEIVNILTKLGFQYERSKGSHQVWKGKDKTGQTRMVVIAPHRYSDIVPPGTLSSIIRQAGYERKDFFAAP